jgi:hypothetical protein
MQKWRQWENANQAASQLEALVDLLLVYVSARFITHETVTFLPVSAVARSGIKSATREFSSPYSGIEGRVTIGS